MAILVTGGAGYIGSHTCVELLNQGYDIVVVDNYSNSKPAALERVKKLTGKDFPAYTVDLLDRDGLSRVFAENQIDAVIHFAGLKAVGESVTIPLRYYHNNITGTLVLCDLMDEYGVKKMAFSSSATVYGLPERVPVVEDFPLDAINPYGATKVFIERILTDWQVSQPDISVALLRYCNPVGGHPSALLGEEPSGIPNNLTPYIARVASGKFEKLTVNGDDYPTPDGTCIRDYVHVMDLAAGHVSALKWLDSHTGTEAFNLGTGKGYSVLEVLRAFEKAVGKELPYVIGPRRPGNADSPEFYADTNKAREQLGFVAQYGIDEMCRDTWAFVRENPNGI